MSLHHRAVLLSLISVAGFIQSCHKQSFDSNNYQAWFGGEVSNPTSPYVKFCRNSEVIDSVKLDKDNRFMIRFDSLTPGMYTFRNDPEYQYVYFDKNDSLMVQVNARDFDNSVVFCGRGDQKNNFLMDLYLMNEQDRSRIFDIFDYDVPRFLKSINSSYAQRESFYQKKKDEIKWSDPFDLYARAALDFHHYSKKEIYPVVHQMRTGEDVTEKLPADYYNFRGKVDYNNIKLSEFSPFITYVTHMLNNVGGIHYHNHYSDVDLALRTNINKLNVADTLIRNEKVRNIILNNIAFTYLLEDQNMVNNREFLETYHKLSTDKSSKNEILKIGQAIQKLVPGNRLPAVQLMTASGSITSSDNLPRKKTVLFFWTENLASHLTAAHRKALDIIAAHPDFQVVAINLDKDQQKWTDALAKYKTGNILELRCANFDEIKSKWAITKVHRTIVLNDDGTIGNAFTNLFDVHFDDELKSNPAASIAVK